MRGGCGWALPRKSWGGAHTARNKGTWHGKERPAILCPVCSCVPDFRPDLSYFLSAQSWLVGPACFVEHSTRRMEQSSGTEGSEPSLFSFVLLSFFPYPIARIFATGLSSLLVLTAAEKAHTEEGAKVCARSSSSGTPSCDHNPLSPLPVSQYLARPLSTRTFPSYRCSRCYR